MNPSNAQISATVNKIHNKEGGADSVSGRLLFEQWIETRRSGVHDRLTDKGSTLYRVIWARWLTFLKAERVDAQGLPLPAVEWNRASSKHVLVFINSDLKSTKPGRTVSEISRRRYWTALDRIYAFAVGRRLVNENPAREIFEDQVPPSEDPKGAVLSPKVWAAALIAIPQGSEMFQIRNRAILMVLFHLGLMPQEVRNLKLRDVVFSREAKDAQDALPMALHIEGPGQNQNRVLSLPASVAKDLQLWLTVRETHSKAKEHATLFFSREGAVMRPNTLLGLVKDCLVRACANKRLPEPPRMGPQVVRNSVLVRWLEERSIDSVVRDAGLKNAKGLFHLLDLLSDTTRKAIKAAAKTST